MTTKEEIESVIDYVADLEPTDWNRSEKDALRKILINLTEKAKPNVGFLRQWINENVKSKDHRLITNEDIERFLKIGK